MTIIFIEIAFQIYIFFLLIRCVICRLFRMVHLNYCRIPPGVEKIQLDTLSVFSYSHRSSIQFHCNLKYLTFMINNCTYNIIIMNCNPNAYHKSSLKITDDFFFKTLVIALYLKQHFQLFKSIEVVICYLKDIFYILN